ncbi:MAG: AmmeMemoRadiSam system protein A [Treponema sp.]|jgi:AmmeMemoRadiSam system protein A|nr:AmmeMemoRadiSam system protein A [Treponema sp.]
MHLTLTLEEQKTLLASARETIAARLEGRVYPQEGASLTQPCGAFVTLHIGAKLRGCIGRMSAPWALEKTVRLMAAAAAFEDPRFPPLTTEELGRCHIEISALSSMEPCADPRSVQVGVHGLYLTHRGRSGVLLPQVPVEQGWDLDAYLDYICVKAGLAPHAYDEPGAQLYTFTATVFGEDTP